MALHPAPPEAGYIDHGKPTWQVAAIVFGIAGVIVGVVLCLIVANTVAADEGPNHNLVDNVQDGPRNGIVVGVYADEFCVTLKSYTEGGRNDDHTSCIPISEVKNLGEEYSEGAVSAPAVDPIEGQLLSITAFEIKGGASGLLLGPTVSQDPPIEKSPTVPAPIVEPQEEQPKDLPGAGGS